MSNNALAGPVPDNLPQSARILWESIYSSLSSHSLYYASIDLLAKTVQWSSGHLDCGWIFWAIRDFWILKTENVKDPSNIQKPSWNGKGKNNRSFRSILTEVLCCSNRWTPSVVGKITEVCGESVKLLTKCDFPHHLWYKLLGPPILPLTYLAVLSFSANWNPY